MSQGTEVERSGQPDMQGTFLLLHLLTRVAFELNASYSFIHESCVTDLGLEVEVFREMMGNSSLECKTRKNSNFLKNGKIVILVKI